MGRIEKTVFISYRRTDESWALAVFQDLTQHGYDVFIDYDGIASGNFETVILENINARAHFLVLFDSLRTGASQRSEDWMRREIEAALDSQRNIVPLMLGGIRLPYVCHSANWQIGGTQEVQRITNPSGLFFVGNGAPAQQVPECASGCSTAHGIQLRSTNRQRTAGQGDDGSRG